MAKTHLRDGGPNRTACGHHLLYSWDVTSDPANVDCKKCSKSPEYARLTAPPDPANARVQEVLDILAKAAWDAAKDRNYCYQFEVIFEEVAAALPSPFTIRKPIKTYRVVLEVEAASEEEAYEVINDNGAEDYAVTINEA